MRYGPKVMGRKSARPPSQPKHDWERSSTLRTSQVERAFPAPVFREGQAMSRRLLVRIAILGVALLGGVLLSASSLIIWDGIWDEDEYRFTFTDRDGRPVEGVRLRVENEAGVSFFHFPVADYLQDQIPTTGEDGVLVFHHVPRHFVSGQAWWLLGVIPMGEHTGPIFVCRFLLGDREVHRVRYRDLVNKGQKTVKRLWRWPTWPELQRQLFRGVDSDEVEASRLRIFDLDGNGRLDREERYAAVAGYRARERALEIMAGHRPEIEEVEFRLVERTVVLDLP